MSSSDARLDPREADHHDPGSTRTVHELVAEVYEAAPAEERRRLIEQLLRPLGVLPLVAIAGGVFAKIRFRSGWQVLNVRAEDIRSVRAADVSALVEHAQQVSGDTVDGLVPLLKASPALAGCPSAAALVELFAQRGGADGATADAFAATAASSV